MCGLITLCGKHSTRSVSILGKENLSNWGTCGKKPFRTQFNVFHQKRFIWSLDQWFDLSKVKWHEDTIWAKVISIQLTFLTLLVSWTVDHSLLTKPNSQRDKEDLCFIYPRIRLKKKPTSQPDQPSVDMRACSYCSPFVVLWLLRDFGQALRLLFWEKEKRDSSVINFWDKIDRMDALWKVLIHLVQRTKPSPNCAGRPLPLGTITGHNNAPSPE